MIGLPWTVGEAVWGQSSNRLSGLRKGRVKGIISQRLCHQNENTHNHGTSQQLGTFSNSNGNVHICIHSRAGGKI